MSPQQQKQLALLVAFVVIVLAWNFGLIGGLLAAVGVAAVGGAAYMMFGQHKGGGPAFTAAMTE